MRERFLKQNNNIPLYIIITIFSIFVIVRDVSGINISKYFFVFAAFFFMLFSDKASIYQFIAFIAPIAVGLPYTYICAIALIILLTKRPFFKLSGKQVFCIVIIVCLELLSAFRFDFSLLDFLRYFGVFGVVFLKMCDQTDCYDNKKMLQLFLLGFLVASVSVWGQMLSKYSWVQLLTLGVRIGDTKELLNVTEGMMVCYNQNGYASLCLVSMWLSYALLYVKKGKSRERILYWLTIGISIFQGLLTQSRMFIVMLILSLFVLLFVSQKNNRKRLWTIVGVCAVFLTVYLLMKYYFSTYFENLVARFLISDLTNGRIMIAQQYFDKWLSNTMNVFFGVGIQNYNVKYGILNSAHNSLQEILVVWGIVGMMVVLVLFLSIIMSALKKNQHNWVLFIPFGLYIISTQALQGFSDRSGLLRLMIVFSVIHLEYAASSENEGKISCLKR